MKIFVTVKSLAKRKNYLTKIQLTLPDSINTLQQMITEIVRKNVKEFNEKQLETPLVTFLTKSEIELQASSGKVGFGSKYNDGIADEQKSINTATQSFEDGLYKVFINDEEIEKLDTPLNIDDGAEITFIKFTMLAGRMW